jgi:ketosteroid isomerase-like protein
MGPSPVDVVLAQLEAYRGQDLASAEDLLDDSLVFTSPQDDHLDKATFLAVCFPTADRFLRQEAREVIEVAPGLVLLRYVARPTDGQVFSNVELMTVADGKITEIRVYFGGPDTFDD